MVNKPTERTAVDLTVVTDCGEELLRLVNSNKLNYKEWVEGLDVFEETERCLKLHLEGSHVENTSVFLQ